MTRHPHYVCPVGLLQHNPEPIKVVDVKTCAICNMRAPWCSCGRADYR